MPNDNNQGRPQMPDGEAIPQNDPNAARPEENESPDPRKGSDKSTATWILIALSSAVLAAGLLIAQKKKY